MGHGALGDLHELGDITDAQLSLQQGVQDLDSGAVPKYFEQLRQVIQLLIRGEQGAHLVHRVHMDPVLLAAGDNFTLHSLISFQYMNIYSYVDIIIAYRSSFVKRPGEISFPVFPTKILLFRQKQNIMDLLNIFSLPGNFFLPPSSN